MERLRPALAWGRVALATPALRSKVSLLEALVASEAALQGRALLLSKGKVISKGQKKKKKKETLGRKHSLRSRTSCPGKMWTLAVAAQRSESMGKLLTPVKLHC